MGNIESVSCWETLIESQLGNIEMSILFGNIK